MRELDELRDRIKKRWLAGEVTEEAYDEGLVLIGKVESYLVNPRLEQKEKKKFSVLNKHIRAQPGTSHKR